MLSRGTFLHPELGDYIVVAILRDKNAVLNVATVLSDFRGIDGFALSVPRIVGASGARPLRETPFSNEENARLHSTAVALEKVAADPRG